MRFVFLTLGYHPDLDGGAFRYAAEVAERLAARGHGVDVVTSNPEDRLPAQERLRGVDIHRVGGRGGWAGHWRARNRAASAVVGQLMDRPGSSALLVSHHAYFAPAFRRRRPVTFFHGPWGLEYSFTQAGRSRGLIRRGLDPLLAARLHATERRALAGSRRVLVASDYMRSGLQRWHPRTVRPEDIEVVGGGADYDRFRPPADRAAERARRGLSPEDRLFLAVRRLDPRMGLARLIDAFAGVAPRFPRAQMWMAGRGPQRAELEARAAAAGLAGRVKLLGFVPEDDLPGLYGSADWTVMPSLDLEGFGLATAESLGCGTPVLASDSGANPELLWSLSRAAVYPSADPGALADRMARLLDGTLELPSRAACAAYARERLNWDRPVAAFERAHDELLAKGGGA